MDAKELPRRSHQTFIFNLFFVNFVLRDPLGGRSRRALHLENMQYHIGFTHVFDHVVLRAPLGDRPRRALHFQNMQYRIGFIDVLDALIEPMLDHRTVTPKSKNERHAAWERSGAKRNERHAAWERFSYFYVPVGCLQDGPPQMRQTIIFKVFFDVF